MARAIAEEGVVIGVTNIALTLSLPCWRFIMKTFVFGHFLDSLPSILDECLLLRSAAACVYHVRMSMLRGRVG
jgi:hypothetical protein